MARLLRISALQFVRAIERDGWYFIRQRGSHRVYAHSTKPGLVVVPWHARDTLRVGLLSDMLKDAGLSAEELEGLL